MSMSTYELPMRLMGVFLIPVLYAAVKIAAGILILHFGKKYAKKAGEEREHE